MENSLIKTLREARKASSLALRDAAVRAVGNPDDGDAMAELESQAFQFVTVSKALLTAEANAELAWLSGGGGH